MILSANFLNWLHKTGEGLGKVGGRGGGYGPDTAMYHWNCPLDPEHRVNNFKQIFPDRSLQLS